MMCTSLKILMIVFLNVKQIFSLKTQNIVKFLNMITVNQDYKFLLRRSEPILTMTNYYYYVLLSEGTN